MAQTFLPGYAVTVTIDADTVIGLAGNSYDVEDGFNAIEKRTFGSPHAKAISGQATGTFSLGGHGTSEVMPLLAAIRAAADPIDVVVNFGDGSSDAFTVAGARVSHTATPDGEVDWNISGTLDDAPTFTPAP